MDVEKVVILGVLRGVRSALFLEEFGTCMRSIVFVYLTILNMLCLQILLVSVDIWPFILSHFFH